MNEIRLYLAVQESSNLQPSNSNSNVTHGKNKNAKAEFLATLEPCRSNNDNHKNKNTATRQEEKDPLQNVPFEITLDSYSREPWTRYSSSSNPIRWYDVWMKSMDDKKRLPGFLHYLKERKKAAYGTFTSCSTTTTSTNTSSSSSSSTSNHSNADSLFLIPYDVPMTSPNSIHGQEDTHPDWILIRFCFQGVSQLLHRTGIPNKEEDTMIPSVPVNRIPNTSTATPAITTTRPSHPTIPTPSNTIHRTTVQPPLPPHSQSKFKNETILETTQHSNSQSNSGFLRSLVSKQERTNQHLQSVSSSSSSSHLMATKNHAVESSSFSSSSSSSPSMVITQILNSFRNQVTNAITQFLSQPQIQDIILPISLADWTRQVPSHFSMDMKSKITLDVLKFLVYEIMDEYLDETYITTTDPSSISSLSLSSNTTILADLSMSSSSSTTNISHATTSSSNHMGGGYLDEMVLHIYKPNCAPQHVLEDSLCSGELPQEMKLQQRAIKVAAVQEQKKRQREEELQLNQKIFWNTTTTTTTATETEPEEQHRQVPQEQEHDSKKRMLDSKHHPTLEIETLGKKKRDRRTMEEIQREMMEKNRRMMKEQEDGNDFVSH